MSKKYRAEDAATQLNEEQALQALDGQRQLFNELAHMFLEDAPRLMTDLEQSVSESDWQSARRCAHSLKGLASTFYAGRTVEAAAAAEAYFASAAINLPGESKELHQLESSLKALIEELREYLVNQPAS